MSSLLSHIPKRFTSRSSSRRICKSDGTSQSSIMTSASSIDPSESTGPICQKPTFVMTPPVKKHTLGKFSKYISKDAPYVYARPPHALLTLGDRHLGPTPPTLDFLYGTWAITYSTLDMWQQSRNARVSYRRSPKNRGKARMEEIIKYEKVVDGKTVAIENIPAVNKIVEGDSSRWTWRGHGLLCFITSSWEILATGETKLGTCEVEKWAIVWFGKNKFTLESIEVYSSRPEGLSRESTVVVMNTLSRIKHRHISALLENLRPVEISLPYKRSV